MRGQGTPEQYDELKKNIKESSLQDFERWVDGCAGTINQVNVRGDTRTTCKEVKVLSQKQDWWFGFIERMFPGMHPVRVVVKVVLDQTIGMVCACAPSLPDLFPEIFVRHMTAVRCFIIYFDMVQSECACFRLHHTPS